MMARVAACLLVICLWATEAAAEFDALTRAAIRGEAEKVEALLGWGADPNRRTWMGLTPLSAAMRSCTVTPGVVYALVKAGADVETRSGIGATPLMLAWQFGRADLADMLLALGADPTARNIYGDDVEAYRLYFSDALDDDGFSASRYTTLDLMPRGAGGSEKCALADARRNG